MIVPLTLWTLITAKHEMIILDTHIWVWLVQEAKQLRPSQIAAILAQENDDAGVIGICATTLWEVAMLVQRGRIRLSTDLPDWFENALAYPRLRVINMSPAIAIQSANLPGNAQLPRDEQIRDPSDQIIVATAILNNCPLVTSDGKIVAYTGAQTIY